MFADLEYSMLEQISKQNNSKLLYVLTHSNKDMDKDELVDMINIGIKGVLGKHKKGKKQKKIVLKLFLILHNWKVLHQHVALLY